MPTTCWIAPGIAGDGWDSPRLRSIDLVLMGKPARVSDRARSPELAAEGVGERPNHVELAAPMP
jgi:hypothetical protein